jgi:hypothetical protein
MAEQQGKQAKYSIRELLVGLEVDVPVMDVRIAGDMVRLYLYGGGVVERRLLQSPAPAELEQGLPGRLQAMKLDDLRKVATRLGLKTRRLHKAELVAQMLKVHNPNLADLVQPGDD